MADEREMDLASVLEMKTGVRSAGLGRKAWIEAVLKVIATISNEEWDNLPHPAQDWFNENIKRRNTNAANPKKPAKAYLDPATGKELIEESVEEVPKEEPVKRMPSAEKERVAEERESIESTDKQEEELAANEGAEVVNASNSKEGDDNMGGNKGKLRKQTGAKSTTNPKAKTVAKPSAKKKAGDGKNERGSREIIKRMIIANEEISVDALASAAAKEGLAPARGTLMFVRSDTLQTLSILRDLKKLK